MLLTWLFVTYVSIITFDFFSLFYQQTFHYHSIELQNVLLPIIIFFLENKMPFIRRIPWAPLHYRPGSTWPVRSYAFFKGWLLPSPPSGYQGTHWTFPTKVFLWDLMRRSGLLPFWLLSLAITVCLLPLHQHGIWSFIGAGKALGHPTRRFFLYRWDPASALPPVDKVYRSTSIDFAENQLYPSSIGFSPLL
jgi:hypothetical protein